MTLTFPAQGSSNWDAIYEPILTDHESRITAVELTPAAAGTGTAGSVNVDSFVGADDTAKLAAFISYANAQTYKPLGRLTNRQYNWAGPIAAASAPGLSLAGPDLEREYKSTTSYKGMAASIKCRVSTTSAAGYFWGMAADWPAASVRGIHFDGGNQSHDFIQTAASSGNKQLVHHWWRECGFTNYRNVFANTVQGGGIHTFHVNSISGQAFRLYGSDFALGGGPWQFIDNCGPGLAPVEINLGSGLIDNLYITPTAAGCAVLVAGGSGSRFTRMNLDSAGQDATTTSLCQGALIQLRGGTSIWDTTRLFGGMYNASAGLGGTTYNKGLITATGGTHLLGEVLFESKKSRGTPFTVQSPYPAGTPHLYVTSGARVTVGALAVVDDTTVGGTATDPLRLRQAVAGRIINDLTPFIAVG